MKKHICALTALLMALVLPLTACGDVGIVTSEDGPTGIYIGDNTFTIDDEPDDEPDAPAVPEDTAPDKAIPDDTAPDAVLPDDTVPEKDPGTTTGEEDLPYEEVQAPEEAVLDEDGTYNSVEDVSLYLYTYNHLPSNYITKSKAKDLGWTGGSLEKYAPGCAIGGDRFGNREGVLPEGNYHECDIDTLGESSRGAKRIVYSDDGRIYYTDDHYETFTLLYGEE